jgi:adenylylsulfate kinase-like enzyme
MSLAGAILGVALHREMTPPASLPIAILDRGSLLTTLDDSLPESDRAERIRRFESAARHLSDAGYLVIDRGWVLAAPEDFYVNLDSLTR